MENGKLFYHAHPNPKFFVVFLYQPVYPICLSIAFLSHILVEHFSTNFSQNLSQKLFFDVFKIFSKPFQNLSKPFQNLFKTSLKPFQPGAQRSWGSNFPTGTTLIIYRFHLHLFSAATLHLLSDPRRETKSEPETGELYRKHAQAQAATISFGTDQQGSQPLYPERGS